MENNFEIEVRTNLLSGRITRHLMPLMRFSRLNLLRLWSILNCLWIKLNRLPLDDEIRSRTLSTLYSTSPSESDRLWVPASSSFSLPPLTAIGFQHINKQLLMAPINELFLLPASIARRSERHWRSTWLISRKEEKAKKGEVNRWTQGSAGKFEKEMGWRWSWRIEGNREERE